MSASLAGGRWGYVTAVFPDGGINIKQRQHGCGLGGHVSVGFETILGRDTRGSEVFLPGPKCLRQQTDLSLIKAQLSVKYTSFLQQKSAGFWYSKTAYRLSLAQVQTNQQRPFIFTEDKHVHFCRSSLSNVSNSIM